MILISFKTPPDFCSVSFNSVVMGCLSIGDLKETSHIIFILMGKRHFKISARKILCLCSQNFVLVQLSQLQALLTLANPSSLTHKHVFLAHSKSVIDQVLPGLLHSMQWLSDRASPPFPHWVLHSQQWKEIQELHRECLFCESRRDTGHLCFTSLASIGHITLPNSCVCPSVAYKVKEFRDMSKPW